MRRHRNIKIVATLGPASSDYDTIRALFPTARFAKLAGAGHWLHAERPREFEETVEVFLDA